MAGVYIKGMEMPKTCEDCNLESFCDLWVVARRMCDCEDHKGATIRHPDCPLIEVPDHGRLIDADALIQEIEKWDDVVTGYIKQRNRDMVIILKDQEAVIPAEPPKEET